MAWRRKIWPTQLNETVSLSGVLINFAFKRSIYFFDILNAPLQPSSYLC